MTFLSTSKPLFSFCYENFYFKCDDTMFPIRKYHKYSASIEIAFYSLNIVNLIRKVQFMHIIPFVMITKKALISVIFYNMKYGELHFYRVREEHLISHNVIAEFVLKLFET